MSTKQHSNIFKKFAFEGFAFVAGFCGIAFEYTFSKFSADLLGSSAQQWALVIGLMLLAMGIGSDYQKKIPNSKLLHRFFFYELLLSVIGGVGPILLLATFSMARMYYMPVLFLLVFTVGFFIGTEIPILARLNQENRKKLQDNLAGVFRVEYIGGFVGAMVWAFFIVQYFPNMLKAALFVASFNLLAASLVMVFFLLKPRTSLPVSANKKKKHSFKKLEVLLSFKQKSFAVLAFLLVATLLLVSFLFLPKAEIFYEQQLFRDKIVASHSSPYQRIVATESKAKIFNLYINGQLQLSSLDEYIYHETLVHPAMLLAETKKNILILGGGDGMALREVLRYEEVEKVVLVDIDFTMLSLAATMPQLVELNEGSLQASVLKLGKAKFSSSTNSKEVVWPNISKFPVNTGGGLVHEVEVRSMDAQAYLYGLEKTKPFKFDVVIIDFPDPSSIEVSKLYALSFYGNLIKHVHSNSIIVQQATSSFLTKQTFLIVGNTMAKAGFYTVPMRVGIPSFGEWGFWLGFPANNTLNSATVNENNFSNGVAKKAVNNFLAFKKKNEIHKLFRYISSQTLPGLFAFPPASPVIAYNGKNVKSLKKVTFGNSNKNSKENFLATHYNSDKEYNNYNTVINHLIYTTYIKENRKY